MYNLAYKHKDNASSKRGGKPVINVNTLSHSSKERTGSRTNDRYNVTRDSFDDDYDDCINGWTGGDGAPKVPTVLGQPRVPQKAPGSKRQKSREGSPVKTQQTAAHLRKNESHKRTNLDDLNKSLSRGDLTLQSYRAQACQNTSRNVQTLL